MYKSPAYYRARIALIVEMSTAKHLPDKDIVLLRNGVFPSDLEEENAVNLVLQRGSFPEHALNFTEQCSFNTFFAQHPEKVAGQEVRTSSREFPITIKGSRQHVENAMTTAIDPRLILPPPSPWRIYTVDNQQGAFEVEYRKGAYRACLFEYQNAYRTEIYEGDLLLEGRHFADITLANASLTQYMGQSSQPLELLEVFALELEPQLAQL